MKKWFKMVTYGLDQDIASKVTVNKSALKSWSNNQEIEPVVFTNYAKIGLQNFYETQP